MAPVFRFFLFSVLLGVCVKADVTEVFSFSGDTSQPLSVPQFDPSLGTLDNISLTVSYVDFSGYQTWTNNAQTEGQFVWEAFPLLSVSVPGLISPLSLSSPLPIELEGFVQPGQASSFYYDTSLDGFAPPVTLSSAGALSQYQGTGNWQLNAVAEPMCFCAALLPQWTPGMNWSETDNPTTFQLGVEYSYLPAAPDPPGGLSPFVLEDPPALDPSPVPEPRTLPVLAGCLLVLGVIQVARARMKCR